MDTKGKELLGSIKSMRGFLGDISQLFLTVEGIMSEGSWEPMWGSTCLGDMSYHVSLGHKWMPREVARPYKNPDTYPNIVAMISVLLDDFQRDYNLVEPTISASYFVFPEKGDAYEIKIDFWQAQWFGWCEIGPDGQTTEMDDKNPDWKEENRWSYMQVFGRPLIEITNEAMLKERIIDPLLELINEYTKR